MSATIQYKPVPVDLARQIATNCKKDIVVIFSIDRTFDKAHITTYGVAPADKIDAAHYGELIDQGLGCGGPQEHFEDFRTVDAAKRAAKIDALVQAGRELLALIDAVEIDQKLGDETDRVFPRYEFEPLRAAIALAEKND
jgi:hypothetical protein